MTAQLRRWCETRRKEGLVRFNAETSSALTRGLRLAREHLGMDVSWLSRPDDGNEVVLLAGGEPDRVRVFEGFRSPALTGLCQGVLAGRLPPVAADAARVEPAVVDELGLRSYAMAPVHGPSGSRYVLLVCASAQVNDSLRPRDADTLRLFAETLADTIASYEARHGIEQRFLANAEAMIAAGGLRIALQPIFDLATRRPIAQEALSRFPTDPYDTEGWFTEARRAGCGLELELDAARAALDLLPTIPTGQRLSLNASPDVIISADLGDMFDDHLYDRLIVEITEHNLADSVDVLIDRVKRLQDRGAWVAIDDAGTGYSSLHQILQLGPDIIKLDRALVSSVDTDPMKRALAHAFVTFTREAGVGLVAEGVETEGELEALESLGVPMAQGYYLARPALPAQVSADAVESARMPGAQEP